MMIFHLIALTIASALTAEVRSCSGCKLNRLADVRKFVKEEVGKYSGITVNFIPGHNPELFIFDDSGNETEKIDLTPYSLPQLHDLVRSRGFRLVSEEL